MKNYKINEQGITLISLVVTIIILLILAGVTIGFAMNGTGLFEKAKLATDKYNNKAQQEETELAKATNQIDNFISGERNNESIELLLKMMKPNTWEVGEEQDFGNGLYGIRLQGTLTARVQHGIYNFGYSANNSSVHIISYGGSIVKTGNVEFALSNYYVDSPAQYGFGFQVNRGGYNYNNSVAGDLDLFCGSTTYGDNSNYDIWFLYTR